MPFVLNPEFSINIISLHWSLNPGLSLNPGTATSKGFQDYISTGALRDVREVSPAFMLLTNLLEQRKRAGSICRACLLANVSPLRKLHSTTAGPAFKSEWHLGRPRGRGRWEGGSGWGIHVNPWLIHVNVWQKPLQYCKVISLQLIKINGKKKKE